jgi:hypothetical protein
MINDQCGEAAHAQTLTANYNMPSAIYYLSSANQTRDAHQMKTEK